LVNLEVKDLCDLEKWKLLKGLLPVCDKRLATVTTTMTGTELLFHGKDLLQGTIVYRCNVDVSFSRWCNKVNVGVCVRDDQSHIVLAQIEKYSPVTDVDVGEALGLLLSVKWVQELHLKFFKNCI